MASISSGLTIRRATAGDTQALYDICLKTADSGVDATALYSDPRLPGYIWAAPYGALEPDYTFVLADADDRAIGYVIGTPDSSAFARREEAEWWPAVRAAVSEITPKTAQDETALRLIANPSGNEEWLLADYPAHLHINILPQAQASGWGRRLIETEIEALRASGAAGVHLGVGPANERAKGFYRHVGFTDISRGGHVLFGIKFR